MNDGRRLLRTLLLIAIALAGGLAVALRGRGDDQRGESVDRVTPTKAAEADGTAFAELPVRGREAATTHAANAVAPVEEPSAPGPEPPVEDRGRLRGSVADGSGAAVGGARVEVLPLRLADTGTVSFAGAEARTATDGRFELNVPERAPLLVRAERNGFAPAWKSPVFGGQDVRLVLGEAGRIEVLARSEEGEPIASARVSVWCDGGPGVTSFRSESETDESGTAAFEGVPRASVSVLARAPPRAHARRRVDLASDSEVRIELVLARGRAIRGRVTSAAGGLPIAGARVGSKALGFAIADAEGRYEIAGIAPTASSWGIGAVAAGFAPRFLYVEVSQGDVELDFGLEVGVALTGRVVDGAGTAVPGAAVAAGARLATAAFTGETLTLEAFSGPDGRFAIDPVHPQSSVFLRVVGPLGDVAERRAGPFLEEKDTDLGDVVLSKHAGVFGRVEVASGAPAGGFEVTLRPAPDAASAGARAPLARTLADPWGDFRFERVAPGAYLVELRAEESGEALAVRAVELAAGIREEVMLIAGRRRIYGRVVDASGRAIERSGIRALALDEGGSIVAHTQIKGDGAFVLPVPTYGEHELVLRDPSLRFEEERVERAVPDGPEIVVRLRPRTGGRRVEGLVRLADGRALEGLIVSFRAAESGETVGRVAFTDARGVFELDGLEDAPYLVEILDHAGRFEQAEPSLARPSGGPLEIILEERTR